MEGIIIVNKPSGMTSHDVVDKVRHKLRMKRVGHAGTLDPLATGVLVMLIGKATKLFSRFENFGKAYRATLILGMKTKTADIEGEVISQTTATHFTREQLENVMKSFVGDIEQIPPMVSAVRYKGKRLYELARKGIEVERKARKIKISELRLLDYAPPRATFYLECSKGTYVRQLAEDIGQKLGCEACIAEIKRTKVGPFELHKAVDLQELNAGHVQSWKESALSLNS
ncbi:MAG: tRNA pseudouridine(55) synthase TruB [Candidatus Omnitrophica bacterium]|nr:tRNA pseudouridine(55) synthase TruB [Candidatus Omnitrophota bacterium]